MRVRPILMTVFTTLIGLLPIMFGTETGSEVMKRIATPMVGGLFSATILTLLVLPAIYVLLQRRGIRKLYSPGGNGEEHISEQDLQPVSAT